MPDFRRFWISIVIVCLFLFGGVDRQVTAAPFYEGKTLTLVVGTSPGGTGDFRARAASQYLRRHLPGNPAVVYKYIRNPIQAANYMARVAKRDGHTIIFVGPTLYSNGILGARGVRYQPDDFIPLGSPSPGGPYILVARPDLRLNTVEELKAYKGLRFAQRSVGHSMYILDRLMAFTLDLQEPKWILGYSSPEVDTALERGEADAETTTLPGFLQDKGHWLKQGFTIPVIMKNTKGRGGEVDPAFPQGRPTVNTYADSALKRDVLAFHNAMRPSGMLFLASKGIPEQAVTEIKAALAKTWADPAFAKDFKRLTGETADPMLAEEIERNLANLPKDPKINETYKRIIGGGDLPASR